MDLFEPLIQWTAVAVTRFLLSLMVFTPAVLCGDDAIRFPTPAVAPIVAPTPPPPSPDAVSVLPEDHLYVIDADDPCLVLDSPLGVVSVTQEAGPLTVRGKFVGGSGRAETKRFSGKSVFIVEPLKSGRVELLVVPAGADSAGVLRRTLDVKSGVGPQPPPEPDEEIDGPLGLSSASYAGKRAVQSNPGEAKLLAKAHRDVANEAARDPFIVIESAHKSLTEKVGVMPLERRQAWKPWMDRVAARIEELQSAGRLKNAQDWTAAWREIATGLEHGE